MKWLYTYRDSKNDIVFKTVAEGGIEADRLFKEAIGKESLSMPMVTCCAEAFKENENTQSKIDIHA